MLLCVGMECPCTVTGFRVILSIDFMDVYWYSIKTAAAEKTAVN